MSSTAVLTARTGLSAMSKSPVSTLPSLTDIETTVNTFRRTNMTKYAYLCYNCREAIKNNVGLREQQNPAPNDKHKCSVCGKFLYTDYYRITYRKENNGL